MFILLFALLLTSCTGSGQNQNGDNSQGTAQNPGDSSGGENNEGNNGSDEKVYYRVMVTVNALDMTKNFLGWSFGKTVNSSGAIVSEDREYTFRVTGDNANANGFVSIYPNYSSANVFYYDLGGAVINTSTFNMTNNEFYTAEYSVDGRVKITLLDKYYNYAECASTFWDDGSFTKDGYILREYNTKADGSGEAYSLGSKYFPFSENGEAVLYCIWEKADGAALFEYTDYTYAKPAGINASIPWVENGVIITKCLSDAKRVVIPEKIGGKAVIAIAAGAFNSRPVETVVLPKTLQKIEDGAFVSCSSLSTMYFPDGIYSISDEVLDSASYTSFKNLIVNATVAPRYAKDQYGAFAVKFCRVLSAGDEKMIIFVADGYLSEKTLTVPLGYDGYKVMAVGPRAFAGSAAERLILTEDTNIRHFANGAFLDAESFKEMYIYYPTEEDIAPPADFFGVADGFKVFIPLGSNYRNGYFWSERGLKFEYITE